MLFALFVACLLLSTPPAVAQSEPDSAIAYTFTTLAGKAAAGSADGVGDAAVFNDPTGIAVDLAGNLYVADRLNFTIRKITPAGVVSTIIGLPGRRGHFDGTNSSAGFEGAAYIAVDGATNLYVSDNSSATIRKITPVGTNWVMSTIAGSPYAYGSADGTGGNARFNEPTGVAMDSAGNLYVTDLTDHTIRKLVRVGTNWVVSTLAGAPGISGSADGASEARFNYPAALAVDNMTNIYVADLGNRLIRKITPVGVVSSLAGSVGMVGSADGTGSNALFDQTRAIAVGSAGNVYVADEMTIRQITPAGVVSTFAGMAGVYGSTDGTGDRARFSKPRGIVADNAGNLYVTGNNTIRKITTAAVVSSIAGAAGDAGSADGTGRNARFNQPSGIALDSAGNIYVTDAYSSTIRKITSAGAVSTIAGLAGNFGYADGAGDNARFTLPYGIAVDGTGNVYVADQLSYTIRKINSAGVVSTIAGANEILGSTDGAGSNARFFIPRGLARDGAGNLYVADTYNHLIRKISPAGTNWVVSTLAGMAGISGHADGTGHNARFNEPTGIAVDSMTNVYVTEVPGHTIRKLALVGTNWMVSTIAGVAESIGAEDGPGTSARFREPRGVGVDSAGNLYVADSINCTIRQLTPDGTNWLVSTIAGLSDSAAGFSDGTGRDARFNYPYGVVVDGGGRIFVADTFNGLIRKGAFTSFAPNISIPYTPPPMNGQLTVTLTPPEANGQWRFPWESGWHNSGYTATGLGTGNYSIEFRNVAGYVVLPLQPVQVTSGTNTSVTNVYYPTISMGETNSGSGSLAVFLGPTPPVGAGWRVLGETNAFFSGGFTTNLFPGIYLIEFAAVSGRVRPPSQAVQVYSAQPTVLSVNYLIPTSLPSVGTQLPFTVAVNQVNDLDNYPFGFNGQLIADNRSGSGVAVQTNVVLTAAHLAFSDHTLTYVSRAYWFFRRNAAGSAPQPQEARGFYILSGYAAQRSNDLGSAYLPDQSSAPSRNTDVAVLYFLQPVAGGGHGGYLPSDAVPNTWLTSAALKMLVGYPVDGSLFGDAHITTNAGKMYRTEPQPYPLSLAADAVPGQQQQVYEAPWFLSYPGNSGGPLYVQLNGYYYPAAVYLGTRFSGSQPVSSLVRAIDTAVVTLITLAAAQGDSGTNYTGGGVITIVPSQAISASKPGAVQFKVGPPAAVRAGAGWRLQGDTPYTNAPTYTRPVFSTNSFAVEFKPINGWNLPSNQNLSVSPDQLSIYTAFYTVTNPLMVNRAVGIGMTGTTGTTYRLERTSSLPGATNWLALSTNTINSTGFNPVLSNPPPGFYRLNWLTNF